MTLGTFVAGSRSKVDAERESSAVRSGVLPCISALLAALLRSLVLDLETFVTIAAGILLSCFFSCNMAISSLLLDAVEPPSESVTVRLIGGDEGRLFVSPELSLFTFLRLTRFSEFEILGASGRFGGTQFHGRRVL